MIGPDGQRRRCYAAGMGTMDNGNALFAFTEWWGGVGYSFQTEGPQGVDIGYRKIAFRVINIYHSRLTKTGKPAETVLIGNGSGRCILDVSEQIYGVVVQTCTITLTDGTNISSKATYLNGITKEQRQKGF